MLKKAAQKEYSSLSEEYLNPPVIFAYSLFFLATLVTVYAFRSVPLSFGPVLEALSYVFVGMLSILILKEKVSKKGVLGMALIIVGVVVFSL
jgi:drug/metabolite transporter (DMT)-like permease